MSEWKEYRLGELGTVKTGNTPSSKNPEDFGFDMPFVTPTDYKNYNKWIYSAERRLSEKGISNLKNRVLPENSILVTCIGSDMGKVAINKIPVISNQQINSIIPNESIEPSFLYYKLVDSYKLLKSYGEAGTAVPIVNKTDFENIEIAIPPLPQQQAIAGILSSLDDKIDLLHRQNKTLEALAETLFRQWFIEEADESWEETKLGTLVIPKKGKNITRNTVIEGEFPVVAGGLEPSCYHNEANTQAPVITVSASGANAGFVRMYYTPVWSSDSSYIDSSITPFVYFTYTFLKINQLRLFDKQEGSAQPHIYPSHIMDLDILNYPEHLIEHFEIEASAFFQKIKSNSKQIQSLTQLRDNLLPKLMSGEVTVGE